MLYIHSKNVWIQCYNYFIYTLHNHVKKGNPELMELAYKNLLSFSSTKEEMWLVFIANNPNKALVDLNHLP